MSEDRHSTASLVGIRVLDLSRLLPGPFCSMMLGDLGAEVIKVEEPTGDPTRRSPPIVNGTSAAFQQVNRNKKSIVLNLKNPDGRGAFLALCRTADVVLEQFRPGVVDRLGVGYADVSSVNPRVVYCSLTGYGQNGPYRDRGGHDVNYLALSGVLGLTTDHGGGPVIPGVQVADLAGAMMAAVGILAALIARDRTGAGQYVDVSMFDVMMSMLAVPATRQFAGKGLGVGGKYTLSGAYPFYNVYQTGDGRYMSLGALEPKFWANFCRAVEREDLIGRQFDRGDRRDELFTEVARIFRTRTQAQWIEALSGVDCCCEPVLSMTEALNHGQTRARSMILSAEEGESLTDQLGPALKMGGVACGPRRPAPKLGEHTDELLASIGYDATERRRLYETGAAAT